MTALSDTEDGPALVEHRSFDERAPTLRPPPEKVAEINAALVQHESQRVAEWLGNLDAKLTSIDVGVKAALQAAERAEAATALLRQDVKLWLFGDEHRPGLSQQIEGTFELAKTTYDGVFNGTDSVSDAQRQASEAIARK